MSDWSVPLGMNVKNNPLVFSVFCEGDDQEILPTPPGSRSLLTEGGTFILTEGATFIDTE